MALDASDNRLDLAKLRFNRLWTCFNALVYLVAGYKRDSDAGIPIEHASKMVELAPLDRVVDVVSLVPEAAEHAQRALDELGWWLTLSDKAKSDLRAAFADETVYDEARERGERFGNAMGDLLDAVARRTPFRRFLLL